MTIWVENSLNYSSDKLKPNTRRIEEEHCTRQVSSKNFVDSQQPFLLWSLSPIWVPFCSGISLLLNVRRHSFVWSLVKLPSDQRRWGMAYSNSILFYTLPCMYHLSSTRSISNVLKECFDMTCEIFLWCQIQPTTVSLFSCLNVAFIS